MGEYKDTIICSYTYALSITEEDHILLNREDVLPYLNEINSALAKDDFDQLVKVVQDREKLVCSQKGGYLIHPALMLRWAVGHRALHCATSLLSWKYSVVVGAEDVSPCDTPPIHMAVTEFLPDFVKLLLKKGAQPRSLCLNPLSDFYMMRPMDAGLKALRKKISWMPTQSLYELIFTLCGTLELEQACGAIGHVMINLSVEDSLKSISYYAREGKVVELATILYVDATSGCKIFESLSNEKYLALCQSVNANISNHKEQVMMLLKLFYLTKFSMVGLNTLQDILAKRMKDAGFVWSNGDLLYIGNAHAKDEVELCNPSYGQMRHGVFSSLPRKTWSLSLTSVVERFWGGGNRSMCCAAKKFGTSLSSEITAKDAHVGVYDEGSQFLNYSLRRKWPVLASSVIRRSTHL